MNRELILAIGDVHAPWIHKPTFTRILKIAEGLRPKVIVQIGDLLDLYSFSRFPKNPNIITPEDEILEGRQCAEEMWRLLQKASPDARCYQIKGNHCDRPMKRTAEMAPELLQFIGPSMRNLYEFENVKTVHDSTEELIIYDIAFLHGYRSKLGDHCKHNMMNTVVGHSHRGGVFYYPTIKGKQIWELNVGYIADQTKDPLKYSAQKYVHWTRGVGLIDSHGPRFIPL
jgi:hypothetical protein